MRYEPPHTVDISAQPLDPAQRLEPYQPPVSQPIDPRSAITQSLGTDVFLVVVSLLLGVLFSSAVSAVDTTGIENIHTLKPPIWFIFLSSALPALMWVFVDGLSAISNPAVLPFARSQVAMKALYAKRFHLMLLAFYFTAILVALCWSAFSMLLVSKLFVSAVFAIALYALGQSVPSRRLSFIISGILFVVVLVTTQAFIVLKLEADSERANQEALDGLAGPRQETVEDVFEPLGE